MINLPDDLTAKIYKLMEQKGINFGSLDFMKGVDGKYYFLEINPVGQFLGLSTLLNLELEKLIAEKLIEKDEF